MSGRLALRLLLTLVVFALAGIVAGVVWEAFWTPPRGVAIENEWFLDNQGVQDDFSGTGLYVLVGLVGGLVLGLVSALTARSHEVATLVTVALGSSAAAALMAVTGHALGPPDPGPLAEGKKDFTEIPADLQVVGRTPYAALPAGAITGLAVCFVAFNGSSRSQLDGEPDG
ncbi:MAG: hypothetical protein ACR2JD_00655 [Nocardioides sp.]